MGGIQVLECGERVKLSDKRRDSATGMWATDATQVTTVQDGAVRAFGVAEHRMPSSSAGT